MSRFSLPRAVALLACVAGVTAGIAQPATAAPSPAASEQPVAVQPAAPQSAVGQPAAAQSAVAPAPSAPAAAQPVPAATQSAPAAAQSATTTATATATTAAKAEPKPKLKPAKKPAGPADVVAVVRTGGIAGSLSVFTLVGADNQHNARILRLASSPEFRALGSKYVSKNTCCDRYSYKVEVGYRNGVKKKITVLQDTPGTPQVLLDVIRLMETMPAARPLVVNGFPFN